MLGAALIGALPTAAFAQATLPAVVVSAARIEQRIGDTFAAVSVLQRADIEASQASDLVTLLRQQPGVEIAQLGGYGTQAGAFIRGGESRHTLVLIDGVPLGNLNFGLAPLEHLLLAHVERIEIARGNLSSLYGNSALGGVIQIFTGGRVTGLRARAGVTLASQGTGQLQASLAQLANDTSFGVDASALHARGYNSTNQAELPGTNADRDGYRNRSFGAFVDQRLGPWKLGLKLRRSEGKTAYDSQFGPPDQADESRFRVDSASATFGHSNEGWSNQLRLTSMVDDLRADLTAFPYFVATRVNQLVWETGWSWANGVNLGAALERSTATVSSDTPYSGTRRTQDTLRVGYNGETGAHQWQANLRSDRFSDFGAATTGLLGYGYKFAPAWRLSATLANGFSAPTFNDLFSPFGGNPGLRPEHSDNLEIALNFQANDAHWRATWFDSRYRDLIGSDANFQRVNIGQARVQGLELTGDLRWANWRLTPSLTTQEPANSATGKRLPRRARTLAALGAATDWNGIELGASLHHVGQRFDDVANARPLGGYLSVDLTAQARLGGGWTLSGAVRNLGAKEFETAYGYRQPGRVVSVTVGYNLP